MRTKRLMVRIVMMTALSVMTAGVIPAMATSSCGNGCGNWQSAAMTNTGTSADQSANGSVLAQLLPWIVIGLIGW